MPKKTKVARRRTKAEPTFRPKTKQPPLLNRWRTAWRSSQSFRLVAAEDLPQRPILPGGLKLTGTSLRLLLDNWKIFTGLVLLYILADILFIGLTSQGDYQSFSSSIDQLSQLVTGSSNAVINTSLLFGASLTGVMDTSSFSQFQQLANFLIGLTTWLVVIWLVRQILATGKAVKLRDGLYNGLAPALSSLLIVLTLLLEAIPAALGILVFVISTQNSLAPGGIEMAMLGLAGILLVVVSLYWLTGSLMALVIVTIPGTYPLAALKTSHAMMPGRRLHLVARLVVLAIVLLLIWAILLTPAIVVGQWANGLSFPLVPSVALVLRAVSTVLATVYIYVLFRAFIDESASETL